MLRDEFDDEQDLIRNGPMGYPSPENVKSTDFKDTLSSSDVTPNWGLDFTDKTPSDDGAHLEELQTQQPNGNVGGPPKAPPPEMLLGHPTGNPVPKPYTAESANDEYLSALKRIKESLSKPAPDYTKGYAEAQQQDAEENRTNRIIAYLSAAVRRAPTPTFGAQASHAADFLKLQGLKNQQNDDEVASLGKLASLAKPKDKSAEGNVEGLRAYLVKVGAGTADELAGMNEKQLNSVKEAYGLKYRATHDAEETARADARFGETKRHNRETERIAEKAADRADNNKPLAPTSISDLADFDVADKALGQLEDDFNALGMSGPVAKISGKATEALGLTGTDAAVYLNKAKQAQQVVGKILEGGKLAQGDEAKYKNLIPQPGDSQALLRSKVSGLRSFLRDMKEGRIKLYKEGGYRTPGGGTGDTVPMRFPDGSTQDVAPEDIELAKRKGGVPVNG